MKLKNIKKIGLTMVALSLMVTGCSTDAKGEEENTYKIGISQYMEHPALDAVREGFEEGLKEAGVEAEIVYQNAQGDVSNTQLIAQKMVNDEVDLIFSIATLASQSAKNVTEGTGIPLVFSAVTDPVYSDLVENVNAPEGHVTGTTDSVDIGMQLGWFKQIDPSIDSVGIIYNTAESNSQIQVEEAILAGEELGITIEAVGITSVSDISQAMYSLDGKVQGLYLITDNLVSSAIELVMDIALKNNLVTISAVESQAMEGVLLAGGVDYYDLGKQSAQMASKILLEEIPVQEIPVESTRTMSKVVNIDTLELLDIDIENEVFEGATQVSN